MLAGFSDWQSSRVYTKIAAKTHSTIREEMLEVVTVCFRSKFRDYGATLPRLVSYSLFSLRPAFGRYLQQSAAGPLVSEGKGTKLYAR